MRSSYTVVMCDTCGVMQVQFGNKETDLMGLNRLSSSNVSSGSLEESSSVAFCVINIELLPLPSASKSVKPSVPVGLG